jgi:hypothetical protein
VLNVGRFDAVGINTGMARRGLFAPSRIPTSRREPPTCGGAFDQIDQAQTQLKAAST